MRWRPCSTKVVYPDSIQEDWAHDIYIKVLLCQHVARTLRLFMSWNNVDVFLISPVHLSEVYAIVPDGWLNYVSSHLL